MTRVEHRSENHKHQTPEAELDAVRRVITIQFDPATAPDNPTKALVFCSEADNGLAFDWPVSLQTFVNPPYGRHLSGKLDPNKILYDRKGNPTGTGTGWARKMAAFKGEALYLTATRTSSQWFQLLHNTSDARLDYGYRLKFKGSKNGAPFCSTMFYRGPNVEKFIEVFESRGTIILPYRKKAA